MTFWGSLLGAGANLLGGLFSPKPKIPKTYKIKNVGEQQLSDDFLNQSIARAKDLASFQIGLDKDLGGFQRGLREEESQANFGRQTKLVDQDYGWQSRINLDTQGAQTDRLQRELDTRKFQQQADINQQNLSTNRAISLASRRLGSR